MDLLSEKKYPIEKADLDNTTHLGKIRDALVKAGFKGTYDDPYSTFDILAHGVYCEIEVGNENVFIKFPPSALRTNGASPDKWAKTLKDFMKFIGNYK